MKSCYIESTFAYFQTEIIVFFILYYTVKLRKETGNVSAGSLKMDVILNSETYMN